MGDYKNLEIWKKSRALTADVYRASERFPRSEMFGITSQMRRAAMSIVLNVAEGKGRWTTRDQCSFFGQQSDGGEFLRFRAGLVLPAVCRQCGRINSLGNG